MERLSFGIRQSGQARHNHCAGPIGKRFGIEERRIVVAEEKEDGILIRPAAVIPVERYTPERKAEFLLSNATTESDYRKARKAVLKLGFDPDTIPHRRPV